jgi:hypothetical protein
MAMPKTRNNAMHADWGKITPQDVGSVIGFVEQFFNNTFLTSTFPTARAAGVN